MADTGKRGADNSMGGLQKRPKWKATAQQYKQAGSGQAVPHGSVGVLVTCEGGKEKQSARETIVLLEEVYQRLGATVAAGAAEPDAAASEPKDIAALLRAEVADVKKGADDVFHSHDTGVKGTVFIRFPDEAATGGAPGPEQVVTTLCRELKETKQVRTRFATRLLPVRYTSFIGLEDIKAIGVKLAEDNFPPGTEGLTFAADLDRRACDALKKVRMAVVDAFVLQIPQPPHKVNLSAPQKTIVIQALRNTVTAAVVDSYKDLAKFNIRRVGDLEEEEKQKKAKAAASATAKAAQPADAAGAAAEAKGAEHPQATGEAGETLPVSNGQQPIVGAQDSKDQVASPVKGLTSSAAAADE